MERIKTNIKGLDELIDGGIPKGFIVLLSGSPGTGKTIFGLNYIYNGANDFDQVGLYVSFEQKPDDIREQAKQFKMTELEKLEQEGKVIIKCFPIHDINKDTVADIIIMAKENNAQRIVIDSLSALSINAPMLAVSSNFIMGDILTKENSHFFSPSDLKKNFIYKFINEIKMINGTALLIGEDTDQKSSSHDISEFACDGVINLKRNSVGEEISRTIHFDKLRLSNINVAMKEYEITSNGIEIINNNLEEGF
jgi:circadian clock protein KaiC